jgi:hypothetical protein
VTIKLFVKEGCPRCPEAKLACVGLSDLEVFDVDEVDGLAEARFYGVLATPSVLIVDAQGHEVAGWRGQAPERARLRMYEVLS